MTKAIQAWADSAMFEAEPMDYNVKKEGPRVFLLEATPDPLGSIAAFSAMYTGNVIRNKRDVTDEERRYHLEEMKKTKLKAPLEAVHLHWMVEGVTRSFTHQMVRQRTAVYAQESLRFAVKSGMSEEVALPPSLAGTPDFSEEEIGYYEAHPEEFGRLQKEHRWRLMWETLMLEIDDTYNYLVNDGMPAEDARGALPHNVTTRLNYDTNLRAFQDHAGNRLCTQAQFEWRAVWGQFVKALREHCSQDCLKEHDVHSPFCDNWQWKEIAGLFAPVCYLTGSCAFKADFDRKCSIRERVDANSKIARPSSEWDKEYDHTDQDEIPESEVIFDGRNNAVFIGAIQPREWLMDPGAAR